MESSKDATKKLHIAINTQRCTENIEQQQKCTVAATSTNASQVSTKLPTQPSIASVLCRPGQMHTPSQLPGISLQETSWMGNQSQSRAGLQLQIPGHSFYQPPMCYGYFPTYHGFLNNTFTEYLAMGKSIRLLNH